MAMEMKNAPKVTMWYLPRDVDYEAWNVRSNHRRAARVVDTIKSGEIFFVSDTYESRNGEKWLKVVQISKRSCREGWAHNSEGVLRPVGDLQHDAIAGINYVLPKFLHYDSWNVRASQRIGSRVIRVIRAGEPFLVTKRVQRGREEWLKLDRGGWAKNVNGILRPVVGGETLFAPLEVSSSSPSRRSERLRKHREDSIPPTMPPPLKKFKSMTARRAFEAMTELNKCRETLQRLQELYARANNARDRATRNRLLSVFRAKRGKEQMVELSQRIERLNAELELCGSSREEVEATLSPRETGSEGDKFTFSEEDSMKAPPLVRGVRV